MILIVAVGVGVVIIPVVIFVAACYATGKVVEHITKGLMW